MEHQGWNCGIGSLCPKPRQCLVPAIVFDHVVELNDVLALFVLLAALICLLIFPAQGGLAVFTVNIGHGMKTGQQHSLLGRSTTYIHHRVEEIGAALATLK